MSDTLTGRMNFRVPPDQERALRRAAALEGESLSSFVLRSAVTRAHDVIENANRIEMSDEEFRHFVAELGRPAEVVPELSDLFARHSQIPPS